MEHAKLPLEMPENKKDEGPVTCLGMTFENDQKRREYFTEILRQKLPELKKIEGYPIGEDEDILALSDPPYYTACPNPFINDFMEEWEREKNEMYRYNDTEYHREPFASDVTEGKNDPIYNAHSYFTKAPYKAIMRYILHYTNPGDVIFDGFCGSGMTGVAAQLCSDPNTIKSLGYKVDGSGLIFEETADGAMKRISQLGFRKTILADISPAATFISHNYNKKSDVLKFQRNATSLLKSLIRDFQWAFVTFADLETKMYDQLSSRLQTATKLDDLKEILEPYKSSLGQINYVVWSDVFTCSNCSRDVVYWEAAVDRETKAVSKEFECFHCGASLASRTEDRAWTYYHDRATGQSRKIGRQVPVLINYSIGKKRAEKKPDKIDIAIIDFFERGIQGRQFPTEELPVGYNTRQPIESHGFTNVHHFYTTRILSVLSTYLKYTEDYPDLKHELLFLHGSVLPRLTKMNRYMPQHGSRALVGPMINTLYIPPMSVENNPLNQIEFQLKKISKALNEFGGNVISTQSSSQLSIPDQSVDYIFIDPPFGANIMYSELNSLRESWFKVLTNNSHEAIENQVHGKDLVIYKDLITNCLKEAYRVLKPGRWVTLEFSNTRASVWNVIQSSLQEVGFVIAGADALDKKRGGLHAMIGPTAVKQDLIISCYKPTESMLQEVNRHQNSTGSAWAFTRRHLEQLPVFIGIKGSAELIVERTPRVLFDRMVAYHVQNGYSVPISAAEFQEGVAQRFPMRDGMAFLETQVIEYDKKRLLAKEFVQTTLFVSDENSAIEWLRQQLMQKPQTRQDLHPNFMKKLQHISKHELLPELDVLLEQNFLMYDGTGPVPSQIHGYLSTDFKDLRNLEKDDPKLQAKAKNRWYVPDPNKQADLEKLRERSLLREFNSYIEELGKSKKKLRQFRTEAIRAGFKVAWGNQDYQTIVDVGQRLPEKVLQEDSTMLMYYDNAQVRLGM